MGIKQTIGAVVIGGAIVVGGITLIASIEKVKPGYAGIVYNMSGGVQQEVLGQGWHLISPTKKVTKYPISMESIILNKDEKGSFSIPTSSGKTVEVDLEASISFDGDKLPTTFSKFRGKSSDVIIDTFIIPKIKAYTAEVTSQYDVLDIYGDKRNEINKKCLVHLQEKFKEFGINIEAVNFTKIQPDPETQKAIQARVNAQQQLEQEKIEKQKAVVEAEKKKIVAQGNAEAHLIRINSEAEGNKKMTQSLNDALVKYKEIEKWNGSYVKVQGGNPIVDTRNDNAGK